MADKTGVRVAQRRRRQDTRKRILAAARELLEDRPWSEISVEDIMDRAQLSRTSFYRHFDDRQLIVVAMVDELELSFEKIASHWTEGTGDHPRNLRSALRELAVVHVDHGRVLQAMADIATGDPDLREAYLALHGRLTELVRDMIEREVAAGRSHVTDPEETSRALLWMNERYLLQAFGRTSGGDVDRTAGTLGEIWVKTIYS